MEGARIGRNCRIFPGAVISGLPQDLKFEGEETTCIIGDNTTIRECVTISRGTKAAGTTKIGNNCLLMAYAHVAHDCMLGDNVILANSVGMSGHCEVGNFVVIGGLTGIHQFVKIGSHVMIAGGSLVRKDIPALCQGRQRTGIVSGHKLDRPAPPRLRLGNDKRDTKHLPRAVPEKLQRIPGPYHNGDRIEGQQGTR